MFNIIYNIEKVCYVKTMILFSFTINLKMKQFITLYSKITIKHALNKTNHMCLFKTVPG